MNRKALVKRAYEVKNFFTLKNPVYSRVVKRLIISMLTYDIGKGDITTDVLLRESKKGEAKIVANSDGILAGGEEFSWLYARHGVSVKQKKNDGEQIKRGDVLFVLKGDFRMLLLLERTGLNLLQRMSGIATKTNRVAKMVEDAILVLATRKTYWSYLDKKAVYIGGGYPHRLGLYDAVLIKDNHLKAMKKEADIAVAISRAWTKRNKTRFIEIEVRNKEEAIQVARKFRELQESKPTKTPCIIMFDNMKPHDIHETIKTLKEMGLYEFSLFEASGGINEYNVKQYATTGVDAVSLGSLTHSAEALDIKEVF
ncbi:MAG: carboxylating nicotinate-nucleotide diphosphorylase [Candidatus Aenigmarchaeota archaeon]|nr:carboxylating nicotinate-nucleotide diphosphorylase [Candidatus Aenigmarchaeota archaeon]